MPKDDLWSKVKSLAGFAPKPLRFRRFLDGMGNFEISYPETWRFDPDIALVDGKYTISFQSPDCLCQFVIAVDTQLASGFQFQKYAKAELESPTSGIYTPMKKSIFHSMPAFERDYSYSSGGRRYFGGGVMFYTGQAVFSICWSAPESRKGELGAAFKHMLDTLIVKEGYLIRRKKRIISGKLAEIAAMQEIRET